MDNQTTITRRDSLLGATTLAAVGMLRAEMAFAPSQAEAQISPRAQTL